MSADKSFSNIHKMIEFVGKEKGIEKQVVVDAVIQGLLAAARKKYGTYREIEAQYNDESGEVELFEFKEVVNDVDFIDEEVEIKMSDALHLDPDAQLNDFIGVRLEIVGLGRIAAQVARQIITQQVRDAEREIIFEEFDQRKGEIASGIARRVERGAIVVDMGRTEAYIPIREQIPGEMYRPGERIQGYISDVRQTTRGPQIIMSRADKRYLMKLFEIEVPEIEEGLIELVNAAREPGQRAKLAVYSKDPTIDPVGACVGMKGNRVQAIVQELRGEKIDVVPYEEDPALFVCNALRPAEIAKVFMDEENKEMEVVVPDDQLSLAIGRRGQNVRLASHLTGWKIDILSESDAAAKTSAAIFNLTLIPSVSETLAQSLFQSGFGGVETLAQASIDQVAGIPGYETEDQAKELIATAQEVLQSYKDKGEELPKFEKVEVKTTAAPGQQQRGAKAQAEARLQEELAQLQSSESTGDVVAEATEVEAGAEENAVVEELVAEKLVTEESAEKPVS